MITKRIKRWIISVMPVLLTLLGTTSVTLFDKVLIIVPSDSSFHFSLMTVNSLFGGFLYTNYGLLVGMLDNSTIQKVNNTDIIPKRNSHVLRGIIYAIVSVICGLYIVLFEAKVGAIWDLVNCWMLNAEIVFMVFSIIYYLLSLREMNQLVKALHKPSRQMTEREIEMLRKKIIEETTGKYQNNTND